MGHICTDLLNQRTRVPHLAQELMWKELQKGREWLSSLSISHSGVAGHRLDCDCQVMPYIGKVVVHQETAKQPISEPGRHTASEEGRRAPGSSLASPGIS